MYTEHWILEWMRGIGEMIGRWGEESIGRGMEDRSEEKRMEDGKGKEEEKNRRGEYSIRYNNSNIIYV